MITARSTALREPRVEARWTAGATFTTVLAAVYLAVLIGACVRWMWPSLFRPWFFSSDEYVIAGEVVRFAQFDFHQHFVDMPGTPFMVVGTAVWSVAYFAFRVLGLVGPAATIGDFTFQHLSALFVLLRAETLFFYCLSIVLLFWLTTEVANRYAAFVAALILAMSPIYASYSSLIRVESLSMCFALGSLLCIVSGRERGVAAREDLADGLRTDRALIAGVLAGLAAATRLHSITATLPVLTLMIVASTWRRAPSAYPRWVAAVNGAAVAALIGGGLAAVTIFRTDLRSLPHARHLIVMAFAAATTALLILNAAYRAPSLRRAVITMVPPDLIRMLIGCCIGVAVGMAPVLFEFGYLLRSMEMYSGSYIDTARMALPLWDNVRLYVSQYLHVFVPDPVWMGLWVAGICCVLVSRRAVLVVLLAGACLFFVSKPLNLLAFPHHVILWLPYWAVVCSYPVGIACATASRAGRSKWGGYAALLVILVALSRSTTVGPRLVAGNTRAVDERLHNVVLASDWIKSNSEAQSTVAIAYFCFNPEVFYTWMRTLAVPVPDSVLDGRQYIIWWGHKSSLRGKTGYACATKQDVESLKTRLDALAPGEGTDPFTDPAFRQVRTFGSGPNEVTLFRFDYR